MAVWKVEAERKGALRYISMFSGIEAATVAFHPLGWEPVCFAEIEAFPSAVLAHHYPDVPNVGDMTAHDWAQYNGSIDLVIGGPPCQAFSVAGLRKSLDDARGTLSLEYVRAIHAIGPAWAVTENVPGWLSTKDNAFGCYLSGLVGADAPYIVHCNKDGGRTRVWFPGLLEKLRGEYSTLNISDSPNSAEGCSLSRVLETGPIPRKYFLSALACKGILRRAKKRGKELPAPLAHALKAVADSELTSRTKIDRHAVVHALRGEGFDASEDGTGRGTPLVAIAFDNHNGATTGDVAHTVRSNCGAALPMVAHSLNTSGQRNDGTVETFVPVVFQETESGTRESGTAGTQCAGGPGRDPVGTRVRTAMGVRRLTPRECERLQGFPDDYTRIPYRKKSAGRCPDSPRYKAIGNSKAVPVVRWIAERIDAQTRKYA